MVGAPRIDKIQVPQEKQDNIVEIDVTAEDEKVLANDEAASLLGGFWDRILTEFNVAKALSGHAHREEHDGHGQDLPAKCQGADTAGLDCLFSLREDTGVRQKLGKANENEKPSPECLSYETMSHCLLDGAPLTWASMSEDEKHCAEIRCWEELDRMLIECGRCGSSELGQSLTAGDQGRRANARKLFVAALAEWVNMHDLHRPFPLGPPSKDQPCTSIENEHSAQEKLSCNK